MSKKYAFVKTGKLSNKLLEKSFLILVDQESISKSDQTNNKTEVASFTLWRRMTPFLFLDPVHKAVSLWTNKNLTVEGPVSYLKPTSRVHSHAAWIG